MSTKRESGADAADAQKAPRQKRKKNGSSTNTLITKRIQNDVLSCRAVMTVVSSRSDSVGFEQHRLADELVALKAEFAAFKLEVRNNIAKLDNTISMLIAVLCPERQQQENTTREDAQTDEREAMED